MTEIAPTKNNLLQTKKALALAKMGYDLMDKKRIILIREMMHMMQQAEEVQGRIDVTYQEAYLALQRANITLGNTEEFAQTIPIDATLEIDYRSVMGVELPMAELSAQELRLEYGLPDTNSQLDEAYIKFNQVKQLTAQLAEVESSVYKLASAIRKTQKRANALHSILIPRFQQTIRVITEALEEKEREDFTRLKVIKAQKQRESSPS